MAHGRRIGRIKLIEPTKDVAKKYLSIWRSKDLHFYPENFPDINGYEFFGIYEPIILEIGCGTGEYLIDLAKGSPDQLFLGIDSSKRSIYYAVDLANKSGINNIHFILGDFNRMYRYFTPDSIGQVILHFPDPNYGSKNEKKKIFTNNFLEIFRPVLIENGSISVVTDQDDLVREFLEIISNNDNYEILNKDELRNQFNPRQKSRFYKAWERVNRPIFHFQIHKNKN